MSLNLINTLNQPLKAMAKFVLHNEQASGLSTTRFIQDTSTCLVPKTVFARSKEDLAENTFLELTESALVYFAPAFIGEKIARKVYSKNLSNEAKKLVAKNAVDLINSKNPLVKKVLPIKAAVALSALFIPLCEYTLNYFKNLMTLKVFNKSDFNNIANLENTKEDKNFQNKVKQSSLKNIKKAAIIFCSCLGLGTLIAQKGANSKFLQNVSKAVLAPGTQFFKNSEKTEKFFNKYFSLDFASQNGKLVLSKGQLTTTVLIGGAGYFGASKDRGKQNFLETLFRFPLIGFFFFFCSDLFEKTFKKILLKKGNCRETIKKDLKTLTFSEIADLAKNTAQKNNTKVETEFKKLAKQKIIIFSIPFLFSIGFMGFFVAGISNLFTKYRFNKEKVSQKNTNNFLYKTQSKPVFKAFMV